PQAYRLQGIDQRRAPYALAGRESRFRHRGLAALRQGRMCSSARRLGSRPVRLVGCRQQTNAASRWGGFYMHAKAIGAALIAASIQSAPALAADPLKIGVLMPTSGVFAVLGQRQLNGMRFAIEEAGGEVAGRKIEMLHEDSEGKPDVGLAKARKLVLSDRIDVMAGIINSAVALAVAPYLSSQRIPLVISNASTDVLSGEKCDRYVFRVSYSSSQFTEPIGLWMAKHAPKNLYILASDYVAPHEYVAAMKRGYVAGGGTIVGETYTPFNRTQDYGPYISQARSANPRAVFAVYFAAEALPLVNQY